MSAAIVDTDFTPPPLPQPFSSQTDRPILLTQGAEAHLYKSYFLFPSRPAALKIRPSKPYRHAILDRRLTRQRILQEARCLAKLVREGVNAPGVLAVDWEGDTSLGESRNGGAWMLMEWIDGTVVRQVIDSWEKKVKFLEKRNQADGPSDHTEINQVKEDMHSLLKRIGFAVGTMHNAGVIHGDLTTSNLMLKTSPDVADSDGRPSPSLNGEIFLIDFGLASQSTQEEDRAVDLYVLERAFGSSHPRTESYFETVLHAYAESYKGAAIVLKRLQAVRLRGRKRSMIG